MQNTQQYTKTNLHNDVRRMAGAWLREQRERSGRSQSEVARVLGIEYYTFVSQIENGRGRIPPQRYADWADALGIDRQEFAMQMMRFYDPITYELVFSQA